MPARDNSVSVEVPWRLWSGRCSSRIEAVSCFGYEYFRRQLQTNSGGHPDFGTDSTFSRDEVAGVWNFSLTSYSEQKLKIHETLLPLPNTSSWRSIGTTPL
jgi:hypothetical protein